MGIGRIETFVEMKDFLEQAFEWVLADFMHNEYQFPEKNLMRWSWRQGQCFAYRGGACSGKIRFFFD